MPNRRKFLTLMASAPVAFVVPTARSDRGPEAFGADFFSRGTLTPKQVRQLEDLPSTFTVTASMDTHVGDLVVNVEGPIGYALHNAKRGEALALKVLARPRRSPSGR